MHQSLVTRLANDSITKLIIFKRACDTFQRDPRVETERDPPNFPRLISPVSEIPGAARNTRSLEITSTK